ncbi:DnaJ C-terminal domain-containing protein [Prochlorococcus marinus]|uniref:DnaJ-class molecular chaperone with C-terminal Zn finger domain n=1 Tax=Prochlorococcus marinus (strain MIT 9211) TaxID=93059 RepID=A9BDI0_PROM4|nr:DnaJ C-terminal domain-containing protein [Prochlorococcus marinus]ABX08166.1 DnaJ-class molecular chaperone with C-terminal Zn finger domain [Prochlorococcus marinus str. MIT 9211]
MTKGGFRDYFNLLGIERNAKTSEIKAAFRNLARKYHPDVNPGDKNAEAKFKEINEAYAVLSDAKKRKLYEEYLQNWKKSSDMSSKGSGFHADFEWHGNFDDFINDLLERLGGFQASNGFPRRSPLYRTGANTPVNLDAEINMQITFLEAFRGTDRRLKVNDERVQIRIPRGVCTGTKLRVKGKGNFQPGMGRRGDLIITLKVAQHPIWKLEHNQLVADLPLALDELLLGGTVIVMTPDGQAQIFIPPGTLPGKTLKLKGKGWPVKNDRGDLLLTIKMELPEQWSPKELELFNELKEQRTTNPRKDWLRLARL